MGLISYFQNLYYDNRLNKADRLLAEGNASEAERIYYSMVYKHPQAACKLAEYYLNMSLSSNVNDEISLFRRTIELRNNGVNIYDVSTFESIFSRFVTHVKNRTKTSFESGNYNDSYSLASVLKETGNSSSEDNVLCSEAKIRLLYKDFCETKVTDRSFYSLLETFKNEWMICKTKPRAKESALQFCLSLIHPKRYYASNLLLSIILDDHYNVRCLDNAVQIIKGHDSEASQNIIKYVATTYAKYVVLREGLSIEESIKLFDACWQASFDTNLVMAILKDVRVVALRDSLINNILSKHNFYLSSSSFFNAFTKWLYDSFDGEESLNLLEKVHVLGYYVEGYYTHKTHSLISELPFEKQLPYLDHAQRLFPNSSIIIDDKYSCAKQYLDKKENDKAIAVSDSIIDKSEKARIIKAQALLNIANVESDIEKRIALLNQSISAINSCHNSEAKVIENSIIDAFIQISSQLYKEKRESDAYSILKGLASYGSEKAASFVASLRISEVREIKSNKKKLESASAAINEISQLGISSLKNNADYLALWDEKISSQIAVCKSLKNQSAVTIYEKLLREIDSCGFITEISKDKKATVIKQLIKRKYLIARELEMANNLSDASNLYKEINALEAKRTPTLSAIRFIICKLKIHNNSDILGHRDQIYTILRKSAAAYKSEKEDIAYRFALILLKSGEDQEALSVLNEFLPGEDYLKKACAQGAIIKAIAKLEDFNNKLDSVKNKTLSSNDAVYFINHMLEYAEVIKPVLDLPRTTLTKYRNKLKNYAIFKLFDEGRYDVAFEKMIKEHKDYLDDYTALRNIALVCLNMAEAKQITASNFQDVISIWLTAIYQEKLFVKSLDYTSWDDRFTFSLYEAYGHFDEDSVGALPDNVNFDNSSDDSVVLIKEVQRTLLDRFEAAISDNQQYHEFFTLQKDAMDSFIALNLDDKCRLVAPYLAHKDEDLFQDISDALEQDRKQEYDNWENLLSVGALYQMPQAIYTDYSKAKSYYDDCVLTIDSVNPNNAKQAFILSKIELIKRFGKLYSALKSYSSSKVSALSAKDKSYFKNNYNFYLVVCSALKDNTLSFVFSNYVMQYVVGEVNSNSMKKSEAAGYILSIFALDKNNSRVKDNLTTLFEMLVRDSSSESSRAVTKILEKLKSFDTTLYNQFNREYEQAKIDKELNDIVAKVNAETMSNSTALDKVYKMYSSNPNNSRICQNLAQLCNMCIMEYIVGQKSGSSSVERILNSLKNNMSSEFRKCRPEFRKAYNSIWNQLPQESRMLLENDTISAILGQSLNDKGLALQKGLNYMKSLGGFTTNSSSTFGRRSSLFDDNYPF